MGTARPRHPRHHRARTARDLRSLPQRELEEVRGNEVAMVFQDPTTSLNPAFTVGSQIAEVLRIKTGLSQKAGLGAGRGTDRPRRHPAARGARPAYPHELSGGMAQRIAIARALSCNPSLLIADEPTTALDVTVQQEILDLFRDLQDEFGMAILFVTHDLARRRRHLRPHQRDVCRRDRGRWPRSTRCSPSRAIPIRAACCTAMPHAVGPQSAAADDPRQRAAAGHLAGRLPLLQPLRFRQSRPATARIPLTGTTASCAASAPANWT